MSTLMTTAPIEKAIAIQGAQFTRNALHIAADATPEQLKLVGDFLSDVANSSDWWKTDYVAAIAARNQPEKNVAGMDPNAKARVICEEQGMEQGDFYFYVSVAAIFPPEMRVDDLSFDHHREALLGTNGEPGEARKWLDKALAEGWDVPTLRRQLRQANATYHRDDKKPTGNGYSAATDFIRWVTVQEKQLNNYTPERAAAILSDLRPALAFVKKLEQIAGGGA